MNAMDRLIEKIKETNNPTVIGLDPRYDMLPESVKVKYEKDNKGVCDACLEYNKALIDSVYDIIPAVKPQAAFYEALGINGIQLLKETCNYAKSKGMIVILDAKRGDIGSTSKAYSTAYLSDRRNLF
jgi:orotidine-5'-phosphate decarboxylase